MGEYLTREEHDKICQHNHDQTMEWAREVVKNSENDRKNLWEEVTDLKKIPGRIQTWFIVLLIAGVIVPIVVNRYSSNGYADKIERQYQLSKTNDKNIETIMEYLKLPYQAPQEKPPGDKR